MKTFIIVCSVLALSSVVTIHAQRSSEPNAGLRFYNWTTTPLEAKVVRGQPYSAEIVSESIQTLSDANRIVQRTTSRVYRDSEGRVRREEDRPSGTPSISIVDPTTRLSYVLDPGSRIARESPAALFGLMAVTFQKVTSNFDARIYSLNGVAGGAVTTTRGRGARLTGCSRSAASTPTRRCSRCRPTTRYSEDRGAAAQVRFPFLPLASAGAAADRRQA